MGIPAALVTKWMASIQRMTRHWQIHGNLHPVELATTGVPEGDSLSVTAMLAINHLWTTLVARPQLWLHAFADNWSYSSLDHRLHQPVITHLLQVTRALALTIDWDKTWGWSTDAPHKQALQTTAEQLLPPEATLRQVGHSRELGYILHYRLSPYRGTQKDRHAAALKRIRRLQHADYSIEDKSHMIVSACLSKALFGTHTYQCGERYFIQLRAAIARALVGDHHNVQAHIAASCLSSRNCDPEFYTIVQSLTAARHFLTWATPPEFALFMKLAVQTSTRAAQVMGPAMALTCIYRKARLDTQSGR